MKAGFYPKMAVSGMRKNGRLYMPYLITCILMVAVFYIVNFLAFSDVMDGMMGVTTARQMLGFGVFVIAIFAAIFLFYTQSTLIKGRKKEFGLYSILGMNKRNIGKILFWESVVNWAVSLGFGLLAGIGLSKLAELGFTKLIEAKTDYSFKVSGGSIVASVILFSVIFFLIYLNSVRQIRFANATQLITAEKAGEKPPKSNWVLGIIGLLSMGAGYFIAIKIKEPISALTLFFVAVILVIIGTYFLLIAGSVILCRLLQKNKGYYYKTNHFVSVSSMAYRMKRNGAGLASICILITMVLVTLSSTSALYAGKEQTLQAHYPLEIDAYMSNTGFNEELPELTERMSEIIRNTAEESGAEMKNIRSYSNYSISGYLDNDVLETDINMVNGFQLIDYDKIVSLEIFDVDEFNREFGFNEKVEPGKMLVGTAKNIHIGDELTIGGHTFEISGRIDDKISAIDPSAAGSPIIILFVVVDDVQSLAREFEGLPGNENGKMVSWSWYMQFDSGLDSDGQIALADKINTAMTDELQGKGFTIYYCESKEAERDDFVSTFGGLFFLGILLSLIFLVSCVVIIYYKQISEGLEDQSRFSIMQKVGMTGKEIKNSINSQMITVFMIPVIVAGIHLLVVLPVVDKLLTLFGLFNMNLLLVCAGICVVICGVFYAVIYKVTSNAYYKIVS